MKNTDQLFRTLAQFGKSFSRIAKGKQAEGADPGLTPARQSAAAAAISKDPKAGRSGRTLQET